MLRQSSLQPSSHRSSRSKGNIPDAAIESLLGWGFGYAEYEEHIENMGYSWSPGLKRIILGKELDFFKQEIQELRSESDVDEGSRSQSNSLESILKRLKGKPWIQSQPMNNERENRLQNRRLLGKDVKIRSLQNYVKKWESLAPVWQTELPAALDRQLVAFENHPSDDVRPSSFHFQPLSPRPASSRIHISQVFGEQKIDGISLAGNGENEILARDFAGAACFDSQSQNPNRMSYVFDMPLGEVASKDTSSVVDPSSINYSNIHEPAHGDLTDYMTGSSNYETKRLSAGWFDKPRQHYQLQDHESDPLICSEDSVGPSTVFPDHPYDEIVQQNRRDPGPRNLAISELPKNVKRGGQEVIYHSPSQKTSRRSSIVRHRLTSAFGNESPNPDPNTFIDPDDHNVDKYLASDTTMLVSEPSWSSDDDDDDEDSTRPSHPQRYRQQALSDKSGTSCSRSKRNGPRRCCDSYRTKARILYRQRDDLKRAHEAELLQMQSSVERLEREVLGLRATIEQLEISRQETAVMAYDKLTQDLIAKKIIDEAKGQMGTLTRTNSTASSGRDSNAKTFRSFDPSKSPLPLRTAKISNNGPSTSSRKADCLPHDTLAAQGDHSHKSSSPMKSLIRKFSKPNLNKGSQEVALSRTPSMPQISLSSSSQLGVDPTANTNILPNPTPRLRQVVREDSTKRLTNDSGYGSLRSFELNLGGANTPTNAE